MVRMVSVVLFDLGGVVCRFEPGPGPGPGPRLATLVR